MATYSSKLTAGGQTYKHTFTDAAACEAARKAFDNYVSQNMPTLADVDASCSWVEITAEVAVDGKAVVKSSHSARLKDASKLHAGIQAALQPFAAHAAP